MCIFKFYAKQKNGANDGGTGVSGSKKHSFKGTTSGTGTVAGTVSGNPPGRELGAGGSAGGSNGGGGENGGGGPGPSAGNQSLSTGNPLASLTRRVLVLSQKGDWVACDATIRMLEKEIGESGATKPLSSVADNVRYILFILSKYLWIFF